MINGVLGQMKTLTRFMGGTVDCPFQAQRFLLGENHLTENAFTVQSPIISNPPLTPQTLGWHNRVLPKTFAFKSTPTPHTQ